MKPELARCHRLSTTVSRLSDRAEHAGGCLRSALGLPPMAGKEGKRLDRRRSWAAMQSQLRPQPMPWGALNVCWPMRIVPSWSEMAALYVTTLISHWMWIVPRRKHDLVEKVFFSWGESWRRQILMASSSIIYSHWRINSFHCRFVSLRRELWNIDQHKGCLGSVLKHLFWGRKEAVWYIPMKNPGDHVGGSRA